MQIKHSPATMNLEEEVSFFQPKTDKFSVIFLCQSANFPRPLSLGRVAIWACGLGKGLVRLQFCLFHQLMVACLFAMWTLKSKFWDYRDWPPVLWSPLAQGINKSLTFSFSVPLCLEPEDFVSSSQSHTGIQKTLCYILSTISGYLTRDLRCLSFTYF